MARISEYTDIATKLILSGRIEAYNISEDTMAEQQLEELVSRMRMLGELRMLFTIDELKLLYRNK